MVHSSLDIDRILRETFVTRAQHHPTLTSTNDRAARLADEASGPLPLLVVADRQTAGRGRGANRWWTGPGSLAMSLLLEPQTVAADRRRTPLVALAAAVAVAETVRPRLPNHTVGIRWPNDVWAGGGKLAGVLVEVLSDGRTVVGIGVNTNNSLADAPTELRHTAVTLRDLSGRSHNQTLFLLELLKSLEGGLALLKSDPGRVAARANRLCLQHGETLTLRQGDRSVTGRCRGIAEDGALGLDTPAGPRCIYSGELVP